MASDHGDCPTQLLAGIEAGRLPFSALMPVIYDELRAVADDLMRVERGDHTLQPTALVHEVFVRLAQGEAALGRGRREFLAVAAKAMRHMLVDHARGRRTDKRGGAWQRITLGGVSSSDAEDLEVLDLHEALEELEQLDRRQAEIVEMCFFAGMSGQEIAEQLGVHRNTVVRELRMARAWLRRRMQQGEPDEPDAGVRRRPQ